MFLKKYIYPVFFLSIFYLSTKLVIYGFLKNYFSIIDSYLLDQLLFFFIFLIFLIIQFVKKRFVISIKELFISFAISALTFFILRQTLNRYFIGDDLFVMLDILKRPESLDFKYINRLDYYYYHFAPFSLIYKFFGYKAVYYNIFALLGFSLAASLFYKLLRYLNSLLKIKYDLLPLLATVFILSTPSILGHFHYLEHSVAIGYIVSAMILSIYFYLNFLNSKKKNYTYFVLSYILTLFLLKFSLTRSGFFPAVLVVIELLHGPWKDGEWKEKIFRIGLILAPFYFMAKSFFIWY